LQQTVGKNEMIIGSDEQQVFCIHHWCDWQCGCEMCLEVACSKAMLKLYAFHVNLPHWFFKGNLMIPTQNFQFQVCLHHRILRMCLKMFNTQKYRPTPAGPIRWRYWPPVGTSTERPFSVMTSVSNFVR
jgi:hypothetical protein